MEVDFMKLFRDIESEIKEVTKKAKAKIAELQKPALKASVELFKEAGWDNWSELELENEDQYVRLQKSFTDKMELVSIDYATKSGQVHSSAVYDITGDGCTCRDCSIRRLPCKHMYFLAKHLADGENMDQNLQLKLEDTAESKESDFIDTKYGTLGCCSFYRDCSRAGHCLQEDDYYKQCAYRNNLENGKAFYTEKADSFSQERYDYIVNFRRSLDEDEKNAFDEIVNYFENTKRGSQNCLCLFSSTISDVVASCNAFEFLTAKELVGRIFEADLISNTRAAELHSKYSKQSAPELKPLIEKLPETASKEDKEKRIKENQKINAQNLKKWKKHYLSDTDLQETLSKLFLFFNKSYGDELNEFFINNYDDIAKQTDQLVFFDAANPKIFREKMV